MTAMVWYTASECYSRLDATHEAYRTEGAVHMLVAVPGTRAGQNPREFSRTPAGIFPDGALNTGLREEFLVSPAYLARRSHCTRGGTSRPGDEG
jgi:hypothetical protein